MSTGDTVEIRNLLVAWRDARQALFDSTTNKEVTPDLYLQLAKAEHKLMTYARMVR